MQKSLETRLGERLTSVEFSDVFAAYLFGSEAAGRAHKESDVDVAVLLDRTRFPAARDRFERRLELLAALSPLVAPRTLDLIVLNDAPPLFGRRIVTEGRRIHCSVTESARDFERDVQLRAADLLPFLRRMQKIKLEGLRSP